MAALQPVPVTGGTNGKVVLFFNGPGFGWSESFYINISDVTRDWFADALAAGAILVNARKSVVPQPITLTAMRVEMLGFGLARSQLKYAPNYNLGPSALTAAAGPPWVGWLYSEQDISGAIHGQRIFRGWASVDVIGFEAAGSKLVLGLPKRVQALQQQMNNVLGQSGKGPAGGLYTWVIPGYNRVEAGPSPPTPSPILNITNVSTTPQGKLVFTVDADDPNIRQNGHILVHTARAKCITGVSGQTRVTNVQRGTPPLVITTSHRFCCVGADLSQITGTVRNVVPVFYQYGQTTSLQNGVPGMSGNPSPIAAKRTVERKVGRPFFGTAGKAKGKCC